MKYALLIYVDPAAGQDLDPDTQETISAEYMDIRRSRGMVGGEHLAEAPTATTVRVDGSQTLTTDGPFADTKEFLGGFYLLEAADLDGAIALAARIPAARMGGAVEIRPLVER